MGIESACVFLKKLKSSVICIRSADRLFPAILFTPAPDGICM
ncbi:hypothetical protein J694_0046 [Acinetobacter sp. 1281984]|nr:hypothetical protein J514_3893 [Acinetobacter sp. 1396970]EXB66663.1 hypothetical protein J525_3286 [Acinetobacter sp. 21871]EXI11323.1 hypothetical protein J604_2403 [Acinetobacter sp. 694762]EXR30861.1 hypothetical protein J694_0046 [Acinetobacter sp. 1281984]EXT53651.1 hypothetical protein J806_3140 [Acinetobacter sp. 25977_3]KCY74141.1 hypothetical protein J732_3057 [Acinetobacter sp. 796380-1375]